MQLLSTMMEGWYFELVLQSQMWGHLSDSYSLDEIEQNQIMPQDNDSMHSQIYNTASKKENKKGVAMIQLKSGPQLD